MVQFSESSPSIFGTNDGPSPTWAIYLVILSGFMLSLLHGASTHSKGSLLH